MIFKILAFVFLVPGFIVVFAARWAVKKYGLDQKVKVDFEDKLEEEELTQYKFNKATVNLKMLGMLIALPGLALILFAFR